ncbi:MAG: type II secretion system protein [Candidatus Omnitrophica bacterium]|nr:type II secretion system protein [Candidatus Omnitrophota bacterium]
MTTGSKGISLIAVMIVMLIVATLVLLIASMMSTGTKTAVIDMQAQQALYIAEAGLEHYIYLLYDETYDPDNHPELTRSFGEGSYTVTSVYDAPTYVYTLTSTATVDSTTRQIIEGVSITSGLLDRGIHADGSTVDLVGSSGTINGNLSCSVHVLNYGGVIITGDVTEGMAKVNPDLDYDYYKTLAQAQGQYYTSAITFENATYSGVYYTTGSVAIGDNAIINASIIAEGAINFDYNADNVQINPTNNYPALATKSGISSTGTGTPASRIGLQNSTINGLILAGGSINFDYIKNSTFNGTMLADQNIDMKDGTGIEFNYDKDIFAPMTPGFTYTASGEIAVLRQKDWNEVTP